MSVINYSKIKIIAGIILGVVLLITLAYLAVFGRALKQTENHFVIALALPRAILSSEAVRIDGQKYLAANKFSFLKAMERQGFFYTDQMGSGYFFKKGDNSYLATGRMYSSHFMVFTFPALQPVERSLNADKAPVRIVYLKPENSGQISDTDLKNYLQILVVHNFADLEKNMATKVGIWIDKDSVGLIPEGWLGQLPQKNYPLVLLGFNNALYSFRDKLTVNAISGPHVDWSKQRLEPGFSIWKIEEATGDSLHVTMAGFDRPVNVEAALIATNALLGEENYQIAAMTDQKCSGNTDCSTPMEYSIRSSCPYQSQCLAGSCAVICPDVYDPEWNKVIQAVAACQAKTIMQAHIKAVTVTLKDGSKIEAFESHLDDIILFVSQFEKKCGKIRVATE
jgi:hypothetical protein